MPEWLIPIFIFYLVDLYSNAMTKSKNLTKNPASTTTVEPAAKAVIAKDNVKKPAAKAKPVAEAKAPVKAEAAAPVNKAASEPKAKQPAPAVKASPAAKGPEISVSERVGLTAGSIWHYLSSNGASAVSKLVKELPEEEKIIQRSIGWLAQEGKITLENSNGTETIGLKN